MRTPEIAIDERVFTAGQTGSGKTYLNRYLVSQISRLVVVDPTGDLSPRKWNLQPWDPKGRRFLEEGRPIRLHYVPDPSQGVDWDSFFRYLYDIGDLTLYDDEMSMTLPDSWRASHTGLHMIYQQGRKRNVRTFGVSQFPSYLPLVVVDQAQWWFCFRLMNQDHRDRMASMMGREVKEGTPAEAWPDTHGFWVFHVGWKAPRYYSGVDAPRYSTQGVTEYGSR